jgi:predicted AlkP superfamily pyrophosphatase or phosphodiesterase
MMRKILFASAIMAFAAAAACAQPAPAPPPLPAGAPRLLVVISVDQFSSDLFDEYRSSFTGGLARIASGASFHNGYQSHAATETCPGHSTILTGDHPARTGIIANIWIDQSVARSDKTVYCAEDERVPGSSSIKYQVSPDHLLVTTLGERLKDARPGSRSVAVSGKDRAAVMMTGRRVDQRWYWTGDKFQTDLAGAAVPAAVPRVNALVADALKQPRSPMDAPAICQARSAPIAIENSQTTVGNGRFARAAGDLAAVRASPELDGDTLALAAALVDEMQLGKRADPDILAISLSATDYVGHAYGTEGEEMCIQLVELDRQLGQFLSVLDSRGLDYAVALTADHGGKDVPERERLAGVKGAARVGPDLAASNMGKLLVRKLGLAGPGLLGEGSAGDMYLDRSLKPADRARLLKAAVAAYRAHPQVEAVFTAAQLAATPVPTGAPDKWTLRQRARASFYAPRSGDFVVLLKRDITPIFDTSRYVATHGSAWDYDRRVPILFWLKGMSAAPSDQAIDTVDIMPTLAAMLGLWVEPGSVDGHCLGSVAPCSATPVRSERGQR